jgi:hypothetical protein
VTSLDITGRREPDEKIKIYRAFSQHCGFNSCRCRLTEVLAGAARGKKGNKGRGGRVRLSDVDTRRLSGLKYKLICCFKLAMGMIGRASGSL